MRLKPLFLFLATGALCALPAILGAEEAPERTGINLDPAGTAEAAQTAGGASVLALAHELFALGRAQGDPLIVLAAAKLAASVPVSPGEGLKRTTSGEAISPPAALLPGPPADAARMFETALDLAREDPLLRDLVLDAQAAMPRGRIGGAISHESALNAGRTDTWEIPFKGRDYAEVAVIGAGTSNLDIVVTDENGNVICFEGGPEDVVYCDFMPAWDGFFFVAVENSGQAESNYMLVTN